MLEFVPIDWFTGELLSKRFEEFHVFLTTNNHELTRIILPSELRGCYFVIRNQTSWPLRISFGHWFARGTVEIFADAVENAVHEFAGFGAAKSFGELDRFIDRNHRWDVVAIKHFVDGEAKHITINRRDTVQVVILAILLNPLVDFTQVVDHSGNQWFGEFADV